MRFAPTADQLDLGAALRESLAGSVDPARALAEMGVRGLLLSESVGGADADLSMLVTVLTEAGYTGAPLPLVDTLAFAPGLLRGAGLSDVAAEVAEGRLWCAANLDGRNVVPSVAGVVFIASGGGAVDIRCVDAGAGEAVAAVDPRAGLVRLPDGAGEVIGRCEDAAVIDRARLVATVGTAAELVGLARRMLDLTTGYVSQRKQFGVPIGSFQAIKHHLADVALAVEFAAPVVASAAALLDSVPTPAASAALPGRGVDLGRNEGPQSGTNRPLDGEGEGTGSRADGGTRAHGIPDETRAEVSAAKVLASDAALLAARRAIQCHGAIGYTTEYELHLFAKRAWALAAAWGSADEHRAIVADLVIPPS